MNWILVDFGNGINADGAPHGRWDGNFILKLSALKESSSTETSREISDKGRRGGSGTNIHLVLLIQPTT